MVVKRQLSRGRAAPAPLPAQGRILLCSFGRLRLRNGTDLLTFFQLLFVSNIHYLHDSEIVSQFSSNRLQYDVLRQPLSGAHVMSA